MDCDWDFKKIAGFRYTQQLMSKQFNIFGDDPMCDAQSYDSLQDNSSSNISVPLPTISEEKEENSLSLCAW